MMRFEQPGPTTAPNAAWIGPAETQWNFFEQRQARFPEIKEDTTELDFALANVGGFFEDYTIRLDDVDGKLLLAESRYLGQVSFMKRADDVRVTYAAPPYDLFTSNSNRSKINFIHGCSTINADGLNSLEVIAAKGDHDWTGNETIDAATWNSSVDYHVKGLNLDWEGSVSGHMGPCSWVRNWWDSWGFLGEEPDEVYVKLKLSKSTESWIESWKAWECISEDAYHVVLEASQTNGEGWAGDWKDFFAPFINVEGHGYENDEFTAYAFHTTTKVPLAKIGTVSHLHNQHDTTQVKSGPGACST